MLTRSRSLVVTFLFLTVGCGSNNNMMNGYNMMTGPGTVTGTNGATMVLSVSPAGNSTGVPTTTTNVIRFSHAMGAGMEQYVYLHEGDITGPGVPMARAWSSDRATLTCVPLVPLNAHSRYTFHMGGGMVDANGHVVDLDDMPMMGGQWVMPGMFGSMPSYMMGPGWRGVNGSYGLMFSFTTM